MAAKRRNRQIKRKAHTAPQKASRPAPGVVRESNYVGIEIESIPRLENFFYADSFDVQRVFGELRILFSQISYFPNSPRVLDALEVILPIDSLLDHFKQSVFNTTSKDGAKKKAFYDTLENALDTYTQRYSSNNSSEASSEWLDSNVETWRQYCANFTYSSLSRGQGMIEFFEASPDLLANLLRDSGPRPSDGVRSVASVVMAPNKLKELIDSISTEIDPFELKKSEEELNE